ncbi:MAG: alpha-D-glucose phosphate-specific phosphoglucomutase [Deltaproteobacteria bacterium]|nr:alpha-D-glucose phosphate-specific phosphoglucomutase [Deltaproteobacteria bacterium]
MVHPLAGKPAPRESWIDVPALIASYYTIQPDSRERGQRVKFGTSGHRGSAPKASFNEAHLLAVAQAVCDHRKARGIDGPLFVGKDTHALSTPAWISVVEVLVANGVDVRVDAADGYTPTPAVSFAILEYNRGREKGLADGIVITPSHNPPGDGGIKYDPPHGGPAGGELTADIEDRANEYLAGKLDQLFRVPIARGRLAVTVHDYVTPYVDALGDVVDMEAIASAGLKLGIDPMGGAGVDYWGPIAERWKIDLDVLNPEVDPTFRFMTLDHDGVIRMDCSSPYAMASLVARAGDYDLCVGNDTDYDRHGIVASGALMAPNDVLAVAVDHLLRTRGWAGKGIGKTVVTSGMLDRVAKDHGRAVVETPVGFKHFVDGLMDESIGFGGEESAGATFLRKDGRTWTTDKDGFVMDLLLAEVMATSGKDPQTVYDGLAERFGRPIYRRVDAPATPEQKAALKALGPSAVTAEELAGETIQSVLTEAPGNGAAIGGLKVVAESGWFAARPSGTEAIYKIYAESFGGEAHLSALLEEAQAICQAAFDGS